MPTEEGTFILCLPKHLSLVASGGDYGSRDHYILGSNLDLSTEDFDSAPISDTFQGSLRGAGYKITNFSLEGNASHIALFRKLGSDAYIHGLFLEAVNIVSTHSAGIKAGAIAAEMSGGDIINSYAKGSINGGSGGSDYVGGLVGEMTRGSIIASYAAVSVNGGNGTADRVGGLVGYMTGGSIIASYATGKVDGGMGAGDFVGGLVGQSTSGSSIIASYATGNVDGGMGSDIVGKLLAGSTTGDNTRLVMLLVRLSLILVIP